MEYPRTTTRRAASKTGRFNGCASVPTRICAASCGSTVSESSVMTKRAVRSVCTSPDDRRERVVRPAAKERVELGELSTLPLPAHPDALPLVPPSRAVKQVEHVVGAAGVATVERSDALDGGREDRVVVRQRFGRRVREVGQQGEMQTADRDWRGTGSRDARAPRAPHPSTQRASAPRRRFGTPAEFRARACRASG